MPCRIVWGRFRVARRSLFSRFRAPVILAVVLISGAVYAQTFTDAKARFDAGDFANAAAQFEQVVAGESVTDRAKAASFVLRSWSKAGRHDKVLEQYEACIAVARGSEYEAECAFERAKSTDLNAKDTDLAVQQYNEVLERYSSNVFAASGALLQQGTIELDRLKTPTASYNTFEELLRQYPNSPFVDDALVAEARNGVALAQLDIIEMAQRRLEQMDARPVMLQKVQLERGEYFSRAAANPRAAVNEYAKVYQDFPADSNAAALAKTRVADLVPGGDFQKALAMYQDVLSNYPRVSKNLRDWATCQSAIYKFQLEDEAGARAGFEALLAASPAASLRAEARRYLSGIATPESTDSLTILYDRGIRWKKTGTSSDKVFWDMGRVMKRAKSDWFKAYTEDARIPADDRAQMLYRLCHAYFWNGYGREAYDLAGRILDEVRPEGPMKYECHYMRAHLIGRSGRWAEAVAMWRSLIDANPDIDYLPQAYLEYSQALDFAGDRFGAALALEELMVCYPARIEARKALGLREELILTDKTLASRVAPHRTILAEKWKHSPPLIAAPPGEELKPAASLKHMTTGGAE